MLGLLGLVIAVGTIGTHRYVTSPTRVAEAFLAHCHNREYTKLQGVFDKTYYEVFTPEAGRELLAMLNAYVPRSYHVILANYPNQNGRVTDWRRYHVRVEATGSDLAGKAHASFVVTLVKDRNGGWRVAFLPTYESLFLSRDAQNGRDRLADILFQKAGARAGRLAQWQAGAR